LEEIEVQINQKIKKLGNFEKNLKEKEKEIIIKS
jgi:hypothetical protein